MPKSPKLMSGRCVDWVVSFSGKYNSSRFKHYFYIDTPTILPLTFAANKAGQTLPPFLGFIVIKCHSNFL